MNVYRINIYLGLVIGLGAGLAATGCSDLRNSPPDSAVNLDRGDGGADRSSPPADGAVEAGGGTDVAAPDPADAAGDLSGDLAGDLSGDLAGDLAADLAGDLAGLCTPGQKRCAGQIPETCSPMATWEPGAPCQYACTGRGQCTVCDPGTTRRCSGDGARLEVCSADGAGFTTQQSCPNGCNGDRLACNSCRPGSHSSCDDGRRSTCRADGTGFGTASCDAACSAQTCSGACVVRSANFCVLGDGTTPATVSETCEMHRIGKACDGDPSNEPCDRNPPDNRIYMYVYRQTDPGRYELIRDKYWVCDIDGRWGEGS